MKQKVYTVFWVYMVSRVIKLNELNELYRRNRLHCRNRLTCSLLIGFMLFAFWGCATTQTGDIKESIGPQEATLITGIDIQDYAVTITANKPFIYTIYRPIDPFKTTIELPDVGIGTFNNRIVSDKAGITELVPYQIESPSLMAKIEMLLQTPSLVEPEYKNNVLIIRIKEELPKKISEAMKGEGILEEKEGEAEDAPVEQEPLPEATEISSIAFERSAGLVKVLIKGNGSMTPNVFPLDDRIVIDVPEVVLSATLPAEVVSPVKGIRSGKHEDKVRLVLDLKEKTNFDVAAVGDSIVIALQGFEEKPSALPAARMPEKAEVAKVKEPEAFVEGKYTGKKISLDFQDADIVPIFRLLVDISGYNIVVSPEVQGKLTMKLINVPWDQALDIILHTFSLGKSIEGNIIWIASTSTFIKVAEEKTKAKEVEEKAEELTQEIIRINYATAGEISTAITNAKLVTKDRGGITIDSRMNTLIIKDTQTSIDKIKGLVKIMDVAKPQVMIEAKIVEVSRDYSEALGIRWGGNFYTQTWPNTLSGDFSVNTPVVTPGADTTNPGGVLGLNIGAANTLQVNLSLSALESVGKSRTLSNPKILTMDNEAATIQQGTDIPYTTQSDKGSQTEFKKATLSLGVTPKITPEGYVQLKVLATNDTPGATTPKGDVAINTMSLTTNALVKNGETLVLGGIYTTGATESEAGVPLLNKIPLLGWLFKTKTQTGPNVKELLIFITPTIASQPM